MQQRITALELLPFTPAGDRVGPPPGAVGEEVTYVGVEDCDGEQPEPVGAFEVADTAECPRPVVVEVDGEVGRLLGEYETSASTSGRSPGCSSRSSHSGHSPANLGDRREVRRLSAWDAGMSPVRTEDPPEWDHYPATA